MSDFEEGARLVGDPLVRDLPRAIGLLERVLDREPMHAAAAYFLGEAYVMTGRLDEAERVWRAALAHAPEDRHILDVLAKLPHDRRRHRRRSC